MSLYHPIVSRDAECAMNRTFATLLNWLDERRTKVDYPQFDYRVAPASEGGWNVEIRHLKV
jgi:hypothetical protein